METRAREGESEAVTTRRQSLRTTYRETKRSQRSSYPYAGREKNSAKAYVARGRFYLVRSTAGVQDEEETFSKPN